MHKSINVNGITDRISAYRDGETPFKAMIGLDGFVDEIMCVVDKRQDAENFTKVETLDSLGGRISRAAGLSTNIELVGLTQKLGGNGPIFANAMSEQGVDVSYVGALGEASIHQVFKQMGEKCELIPITDPGLSFNLEFDDGKLIMSKLDSLSRITWGSLKDRFGLEKLSAMISGADLFGLENWTMIPYMSDIFRGLIDEVFPMIESKDSFAFFDLADPEKRLQEDLAEALGLIKRFSSRFRTVLGVNLKEAIQVAAALGVSGFTSPDISVDDVNLEELTVKTGRAMGIYCFVIHTVRDASAYSGGAYHYSPGFYTPRPKLTTGAGDNFNAGLCLGLLLGLPVNEALSLGTASSGYYVREARSADLSELTTFLRNVEAV